MLAILVSPAFSKKPARTDSKVPYTPVPIFRTLEAETHRQAIRSNERTREAERRLFKVPSAHLESCEDNSSPLAYLSPYCLKRFHEHFDQSKDYDVMRVSATTYLVKRTRWQHSKKSTSTDPFVRSPKDRFVEVIDDGQQKRLKCCIQSGQRRFSWYIIGLRHL